MKYTCTKTPSMFRKCDNIFLLCNVTHLRLGLGKLFMLGNHEPWTFLTTNQKELKMKIEPAFSLILNLCSFLFLIWYDGRKMDQLFEKKLIWEPLHIKSFNHFMLFTSIFENHYLPKSKSEKYHKNQPNLVWYNTYFKCSYSIMKK